MFQVYFFKGHLKSYPNLNGKIFTRVRPRFFDQVGHETMYASSGNKHFFTKQNHEQSQQKLGSISENKAS